MAPTSILLQGGTILTHDEQDHVHAMKTDLLIKGNVISKIESAIDPSLATQVIDCKDKIISPGFIDTHHHLWQTLLKGRHADQLLIDYLYTGNFVNSLHSPTDFFWGELGGALECLDSGTTTVVDHSSVNYSAEHSKATIAGTISSGIRSVYGYCPTPRVESWEPFALSHDMLPDWVMETLVELASKAPFGDGRVQLGLAFDGLWLPKEVVVGFFEKAKSLGIKVITTHYVQSPIQPPVKSIELLDSYGLLDSSILFSHATNISVDEASLLSKTNSHVSSTPSTDLQMALGQPIAFQSHLNVQSQCSLGIDCHSNNSGSIVSEMRLLLQSSRGIYNQKFIDAWKVPKQVNKTVEEAFNLGTIGGARAIGMQDKIGTLAVGKLADLIVFDALSPSMVCASQHDPVAAIVLHSSPADIEMVIVDGIVRKAEGKLKDVDTNGGKEIWNGEDTGTMKWKDVSRKLVGMREKMQEKTEKIDWKEARAGVIRSFYIDESKIVESI